MIFLRSTALYSNMKFLFDHVSNLLTGMVVPFFQFLQNFRSHISGLRFASSALFKSEEAIGVPFTDYLPKRPDASLCKICYFHNA